MKPLPLHEHSKTGPLPITACPAKDGTTSERANVRTTNPKSKSLFISHLLASKIACADGRKLIQIAEYADSVRAKEVMAQIGARLSTMPGAYSDAGELFTALALNAPCGRVLADAQLQQLAESNARWVRTRARLALGSNLIEQGDVTGALGLYQSAGREATGCPLLTFCNALMIAVAHGLTGRHSEAIEILNRLSGLARYVGRVYPAYRLDWFNSVAVELNATGHTDEARKVLAPALTSPFARAYPEWCETAQEINQPLKIQTNVLAFVDRKVQVRRIEKVLYDPAVNGERLRTYASAGEEAIHY